MYFKQDHLPLSADLTMHKTKLVLGFVFTAVASMTLATHAQDDYPPIISLAETQAASHNSTVGEPTCGASPCCKAPSCGAEGSGCRSNACSQSCKSRVCSNQFRTRCVDGNTIGRGIGCGIGCALGCGMCSDRVSPWRSPGNMALHTPYEAEPKSYYYFRPYNAIHVARQQDASAEWADSRLPYSNAVFQSVYNHLRLDGVEEIQPKLPEATEE